MERFSEAYKACRKDLTSGKFPDDWKKFVDKSMRLDSLLGSKGPNPKQAASLDKLREKILAMPEGQRGELLAGATTDAKTAEGAARRAASLKMLWHLYLTQERGGQALWVYSPPVDYQQWVFDEITGNKTSFAPKLEKTSEVYSAGERSTMADALGQALAAAQGASAKLALGDATTIATFKRWFADENTTDAQIKTGMRKLSQGFKKIASMCNNNHLVFSDEPIDRNGGGWKDYAFVDPTETLNVVYPQGAFLKAAASTARVWICVETIVHEISHRVAGTDDFAYDNTGLKPSSSGITYSHAIRNADSWGYFCVDLAGMLAQSTRDPVLAKGQLLKAA